MKKIYTVDELRALGFAFSTNGDIVTPADMGDMAEKYVKYERQKTYDKIEEWLKENFRTSYVLDCYGCFTNETEVTSSFDTMEQLLENFEQTREM